MSEAFAGDGADNWREAFDALIKQENINPNVLKDSIDAGMAIVLQSAKDCEAALNRDPDMVDEKVEELLYYLNNHWRSMGLDQQIITVSGKVRPTLAADDMEFTGSVVAHDHTGLLPGGEDAEGEWYTAAGLAVGASGFYARIIEEHDQMLYRVDLMLHLPHIEEENALLSIHPDDITFIEPEVPTRFGAAQFVAEHFPAVYSAVLELPQQCGGNPALICQALNEFRVSFDVSQGDGVSAEEVMSIISDFISDHLAFDNAPHTVRVDGTIYGTTFEGERIPTEYTGKLRSVHIGAVVLVPVDNPPQADHMVTYAPQLEVWYLVPEVEGGRTQINMPMESIAGIKSKRPQVSAYPFATDTIIMPAEAFNEHEASEGFLPAELGESALNATEQEARPSTSETLTAIELLERADAALTALQRQADIVAQQRYDSAEEAAERAFAQLEEPLKELINSTRGTSIEIEAAGSGVHHSPVQFRISKQDEDTRTATLELAGLHEVTDDMLAVQRGWFRGNAATTAIVHNEDQPDQYFTPYLALELEKSEEGRNYVRVRDTKTTTSLFEMVPKYRVTVQVDSRQSNIFLPEYRQLLACRQAIGALAKEFPDAEQLPAELYELHERIFNAPRNSYTTMEDLSLVHSIAATAGGDEELARKVDVILSDILSERPVSVTGNAYTSDDEYDEDVTLSEIVRTVVSFAPNISTSEPMLVFYNLDKPEYKIYMPLSGITELTH